MTSLVKNTIQVEIVYGLADEQALLSVDVPENTTIKDVIIASKIIEHFPQIDIETVKVGLFGKLTKMDQTVRERDRIEIYRPLIADPKEVRKRRAAEGKRLKKGGAESEVDVAKDKK
ncbi:MAG: RnfH family protein [Cocleimonas sp.]